MSVCCGVSDVVHLTKEVGDDTQLPEESLQYVVTELFKGDDAKGELHMCS
jgi:hypothetical protein